MTKKSTISVKGGLFVCWSFMVKKCVKFEIIFLSFFVVFYIPKMPKDRQGQYPDKVLDGCVKEESMVRPNHNF